MHSFIYSQNKCLLKGESYHTFRVSDTNQAGARGREIQRVHIQFASQQQSKQPHEIVASENSLAGRFEAADGADVFHRAVSIIVSAGR